MSARPLPVNRSLSIHSQTLFVLVAGVVYFIFHPSRCVWGVVRTFVACEGAGAEAASHLHPLSVREENTFGSWVLTPYSPGCPLWMTSPFSRDV